MKRKMIFGISCVAVAIAGLIYVNKSNSVKLVENDLLMENVEALTQMIILKVHRLPIGINMMLLAQKK